MRALLASGADINVLNGMQQTPLMLAAFAGIPRLDSNQYFVSLSTLP